MQKSVTTLSLSCSPLSHDGFISSTIRVICPVAQMLPLFSFSVSCLETSRKSNHVSLCPMDDWMKWDESDTRTREERERRRKRKRKTFLPERDAKTTSPVQSKLNQYSSLNRHPFTAQLLVKFSLASFIVNNVRGCSCYTRCFFSLSLCLSLASLTLLFPCLSSLSLTQRFSRSFFSHFVKEPSLRVAKCAKTPSLENTSASTGHLSVQRKQRERERNIFSHLTSNNRSCSCSTFSLELSIVTIDSVITSQRPICVSKNFSSFILLSHLLASLPSSLCLDSAALNSSRSLHFDEETRHSCACLSERVRVESFEKKEEEEEEEKEEERR